MQFKQISWPAVYSHIPMEMLIQGVASNHINEFPPDTFKQRWVDNKRSIQNFFTKNRILNDQKLPAVICSYEIDDNPKNTLEQGDYPFNYASHFIAGPLSTYYARIFHDPETKIEIYVAFIRKRVTLNFRFLFPDSYMRDDIIMWMLNTFRYEGPPEKFGVTTSIYSPLPQNIIDYISMCKQYDLQSSDVRKAFDGELGAYSGGLLRNRKVTMRHTDNLWFMAYSLPDMRLIQDEKPSREDAETRGQTKTNFGCVERLQFEPYVPSMFITKVPEVVYGKRIPDQYKIASYGFSKGIDPRLFKTRNFQIDPTNYFMKDHPEYTIISNTEFSMDHNGEEEIEIDTSIAGSFHQWVIDLIKERRGNPAEYYQLHLFLFNVKLTEDRDYRVDWDSMTFRIINGQSAGIYRLLATCTRDLIIPYYNTAKIQKLKIKEK